MYTRPLSPIRSVSPGPKPKIVFNYQPSPLKERPSTDNSHANTVSSHIPAIPFNTEVSSFLPKNQQKRQSVQNKCFYCSKQATYRVPNDNKLYCSTCAIGEMNKGVNVIRIELKDQIFYKEFYSKFDKENTQVKIKSPKVKQFKESRRKQVKNRQVQLLQLINMIAYEEHDHSKILEKLNSQQLTNEGIKAIYRQKKLNLKKHYEKIKAAIKSSIQKDLEQLDNRQKKSLKCIEQKKQDIQSNINKLHQIRQDIEPHRNQIITQILEPDYQIMIKQHKQDTQQILSQKEIAICLIKELNSHQTDHYSDSSIQVKITHQQIESSKSELYDPYNYTLIDTKQKKGETLFSFQKKIK